MKTNHRMLGQTLAAALLVAGRVVLVVTTVSFLTASPVSLASPTTGPAPCSQSIPWSDLGAKATVQYSGNGLAVCAAENGAVRLRCAFQRLEGEATSEGLWLTSTVEGAATDRLRVTADYLGRDGGVMVALPDRGVARGEPGLARYMLHRLMEEYSVSVDGAGNVYVADIGNWRIRKITPGEPEIFANLVLSDTANERVMEFTATGPIIPHSIKCDLEPNKTIFHRSYETIK